MIKRRGTAVGAAWLVGLTCLTVLLAGCGRVTDAIAPPGLRRGTDVPTRPHGLPEQPLGLPPLAPAGEGGYAFLMAHADGSPVTWDPCRAVHYVVRATGEPPGGRALLQWAFGQLQQATGLQFVFDGPTDEAPSADRPMYQKPRYGDRWAPVLVAWSSPAETSMLDNDTLGRAGPRPFGLKGHDDDRYVTGVAVFNSPLLTRQLESGDDNKARAVLLHELGHLVGLGHVGDPYQVMFDTNAYPVASYRAGDLRGLELLGRGRCYRDY